MVAMGRARMSWAAAAVVVAAALASLRGAQGEISHSFIESDSRYIIPFGTFGFDTTGVIDINVSQVELKQASTQHAKKAPADKDRADLDKLGFFITTAEAQGGLLNDLNDRRCALDKGDSPDVHLLFTLRKADLYHEAGGVFPVGQNQLYSLYFANCEFDVLTSVTMNVSLALYNMEGSTKDFLPAGKTQLPRLYLVIFLAYMVALGAWLYICYNQQNVVHRIHYLMGALVLVKAVTILCKAAEYAYIKSTGVPHGWNVAYYFFTFFRGIMLFTVIVLIGTGWSILKPFLQDKEKKVIMIIIPLQVFTNVATIILDETGPSSKVWYTWRNIFVLLDIICCFAILFPIVWSIKHLREASHSDGKAARNVVKLTLFRQFYVMVVSYIYFTRIVVYLLQSNTPYQYAWTAVLAEELATLAFYVCTGYLFQPVQQNPYLALDEEEEEAAVQALKDEDFDF